MKWISKETQNYVFNYKEGSVAELDIDEISEFQEKCYRYICKVFEGSMDSKIQYYLCESPEEVGEIYGDNEPCNGFACRPNKVYAVYNEEVKCIGLHEDAHIVSYKILGRPDRAFWREAIVMFLDNGYHGKSNFSWVKKFKRDGRVKSIRELLNDDVFYGITDRVTYPIAGAFVQYLVSTFGIKKFMEFYKEIGEYTEEKFQVFFEDTLENIENDFLEYIELIAIDPA